MSNINQRQVQKLLQKLSPQQIQMIKLLELPAVQLEQRVKQEIEENPVLEEEATEENDEQQTKEVSVEEYFAEDDTPRYKYHANNYSKDDQKRPVYLTEGMSFHENLIEQLGFKNLSPREMTLGQYLIGSIDDDGYLRRSPELDRGRYRVQPRNRDDRAGAGKRTESHPRTGAHGRRVA